MVSPLSPPIGTGKKFVSINTGLYWPSRFVPLAAALNNYPVSTLYNYLSLALPAYRERGMKDRCGPT
jgi:hypothetical protein